MAFFANKYNIIDCTFLFYRLQRKIRLICKHIKSGFKGYMMNGQFLKRCCLLVE